MICSTPLAGWAGELDEAARAHPTLIIQSRTNRPKHYARALHTLNESCGILVAKQKQDDPTTCLMFLGIEITFQLRQPADKLDRLLSCLAEVG